MGAKSDQWMPLYLAKYEAATNRLSLAEDGAYMRLIRDYWVNGAPPDDDSVIARILRVDRREWLKIRPALERYFEIRDGHWFHDTVERELRKAQELIEKRRAAGAQGGRPRKQIESEPKANGFAERSQTETPARIASPLPSPDGEIEDADASSVGSAEPIATAKAPWAKDADFLAAWEACTEEGRARSSRKLAWARWKASPVLPARKLAALRAYLARDPDVKRTGGPGFHLWLRDKLDEWLEAPEPIQPQAPAPWRGPEKVARIMARAFGPDKGADYLAAYCAWQDLPYEAVIVATEAIARLIKSKAGPALEAESVAILVKGKAA